MTAAYFAVFVAAAGCVIAALIVGRLVNRAEWRTFMQMVDERTTVVDRNELASGMYLGGLRYGGLAAREDLCIERHTNTTPDALPKAAREWDHRDDAIGYLTESLFSRDSISGSTAIKLDPDLPVRIIRDGKKMTVRAGALCVGDTIMGDCGML